MYVAYYGCYVLVCTWNISSNCPGWLAECTYRARGRLERAAKKFFSVEESSTRLKAAEHQSCQSAWAGKKNLDQMLA
jgi:hypothetical protein